MKTSAEERYGNLTAFWPVLLLTGFASVLLPSAAIVGLRWSVEFALSGFLLVSLLLTIFADRSSAGFSLSNKEFVWLVLPMALFTIWSGLSIFWAASWRYALHHTLLWTCYLIFYLLIRRVFDNENLRARSLIITRIVTFVIGAACIIEYIGIPRPVTSVFTYRYYSYAEVITALLPLLLAVAIKGNAKRPVLSYLIVAVAWAMVVVTTSRTMFIAGAAGLATFLVLQLIIDRKLYRAIAFLPLAGILIVITLIPQLPSLTGESITLANRFSGQEQYSNLSARSRFLLWGLAIEGFRENPTVGIGGDNYFTNYKVLREGLSMRDPENPTIEINEDLIPERAHNEFLQVLCELGLIGGLLFGWLLAGIGYMFLLAVRNHTSTISVGALSGIVAFLVASIASSYSLRFPTNGLCFFFLLAITAQELFKPGLTEKDRNPLSSSHWHKWFLALGIVSSIAMIGFSAARAVSIWHLASSQNARDRSNARREIEKAIAIDPAEPMFRFYYGQQLDLAGQGAEAVPQMRLAIDNGLATSTAYFNLLSVLMRGGRVDEARGTFDEALRVYPRSVFLRTAFASFLKRSGEIVQADAEYQKAVEIDPKQARSWQLAHDEGLEKLVQRARVDDNYLSPFDLKPDSATLFLANSQRR